MRLTSLVVATCVAVAALSGCSSPEPNETIGADLTVEEMVDEYWDAWTDLELPDGAEPLGPGEWEPEPGPDGTLIGHSFEPGFGLVTAQFQWLCLWQGEWLDSFGTEPTRADRALEQLALAPDMEFIRRFSDAATAEFLNDRLSAARLGDPGPIARDQDLNCQ